MTPEVQELSRLVEERCAALAGLSVSELRALPEVPSTRMELGGREMVIATLIEPETGGGYRVIVEGRLWLDRSTDRSALKGFRKLADGSTSDLTPADYDDFD